MHIFRCLIFASDGLWNVIDPEIAVDSVYETEKRNDHNAKLGINTWRNPSRVLVETALERWRSNGLRADNTSVVCVMLDPPNKRNMFKFCRSPASDNLETIETFGGARTIFDYSTSEAYNLDYVGSEQYSTDALVRQNASYDLLNQNQNSFYQHQLASNIDGRYFQASGSHAAFSSGYGSYELPYYHLSSTSAQQIQVQPGTPTYQTSSNESAFVKACCRNNYLLASTNEQIPYHSSYEQHREMYVNMALRPFPPLHYAYRPVPASQQLPLPSLHANLYDHQGYLQSSYKPMERYNYLRPTPEEVAALHNEDDETESDSNEMDFSDEETDDDETETNEPKVGSTSTTNPNVKESDDSIQIFEITSSSFHANEDTDAQAQQFQQNKPVKSNNKENSEESSRKKKAMNVRGIGRVYLTRQTDRKMRSGNTGVSRTIGREKLQRRMTRNIRKVVKTLNDQKPSTTKTLPDLSLSRGTKKLAVKISENKPVEKETQKPALKVRLLRSADTTFKKQLNDEIVNIRSLRSNSSNSNVMDSVEKPATRKRTSNHFDNIERNKDRRLK